MLDLRWMPRFFSGKFSGSGTMCLFTAPFLSCEATRTPTGFEKTGCSKLRLQQVALDARSAGDLELPEEPRSAAKRQVLLAHPGTQYSFHLARELAARGLLSRFWTGFAIAGSGWSHHLFGLLPRALRNRVAANVAIGVPARSLRTLPGLEWKSRQVWLQSDQEERYFERNRRFQEAIPTAEIELADIVIGFDTSSWILARRTKELGKFFVLDQSIGHPVAKERAYSSLRERFPAWSSSLPRKRRALVEKEMREHELADLIVVPSRFAKSTLIEEGVNPVKIKVIPFGTDLELFHLPHPVNESKPASRVVVLFAGTLTARKGLPVLLAAWKRLSESSAAELWLAGSGTLPIAEERHLADSVKVLGPRTRGELARLMSQADIFVFPSFFEGLAQVQLEALAAGLPVISTYESGAEEVIVSGENGFVVKAGDESGLAQALKQLVENAPLRLEMRRMAGESRARLSWKLYGDRWERLLLGADT